MGVAFFDDDFLSPAQCSGILALCLFGCFGQKIQFKELILMFSVNGMVYEKRLAPVRKFATA